MIRKSLVLKLCEGFTMQRWNDQLRPMELVEIDKQAHKISLAYFLARAIEQEESVNMSNLIESAVFEYFERIVITDIKPPVFHKIKADSEQYKALKHFVKQTMLPYMKGLPDSFIHRFSAWCDQEQQDSLENKILEIAHADATLWEFNLLRHANPDGFGMDEIDKDMDILRRKHADLHQYLRSKLETKHIRQEESDSLFANENYSSYSQLVKMFGQMRFQVRWAQLHRAPKTTVLGHSFYVALLTYLFSIMTDACEKRVYNNFWTAVFHDLPEVFTRDIISPVKSNIPGLGNLIKQIEEEEIEKKFTSLIPEHLRPELFYFIKDEFADCTFDANTNTVATYNDGIPIEYNLNEFNPRDGSLVRFADQFAAFMEADLALKNGAMDPDFTTAKQRIIDKYDNSKIVGLDLKAFLLDFR